MAATRPSQSRTPLVRVEDGALLADGGPGRFVVSRLDDPDAVADAASSAGSVGEVRDGRLRIVATPSRLADAAGRAGGSDLAAALRDAIDRAVTAWRGPAPAVEVPHHDATLRFDDRPLVMGVVNTTPDSFSDGGAYFDPADPDTAVAHALSLVEAGADLVDVGGESTRPGAEPVGADEETARVVPVIEALAAHGVLVSVDTSKSGVARSAVAAGAAIVNDVSAGSLDGLLLRTVAELDVPYVLMHMRGTPRSMQRAPRYEDVVAEIFDFLGEHLERLTLGGIPEERVIVDPGIGFGKTVEHNLELLRRTRELTSLGRPVLVGTSRKSFIGRITGVDDPTDRLEGSLVTAAAAVCRGASIVRVHDVTETRRAVAVAAALRD